MLPGHISENQFANRNRPTTCKIYENFVFAFHIGMTDKMLDHHVMDNFLSPADLGCMNTFLSKFLVVLFHTLVPNKNDCQLFDDRPQ